jgi:hypothetical protein
MAFQADIAGAGNSAATALAIVGSISKNVTAAGTTQLTATKLSSALNLVTTVPASSGVMLPTMFDSDLCIVMNKGANVLSVYPTKDHNIDGAANDTPVTVNAGVIAYFWGVGSGNYSSDIAGISSNPTFAGLTITGNLSVGGNITLGSDAVLVRDAANVLAQKNGTSAQAFYVYNTFTDASNYERGGMQWSAGALRIGTQAAGTGSGRDLTLMVNGANVWRILAAGGHFLSNTDNTTDIGASGANRPRTGYFGTSLETPLIQNGTGTLQLGNASGDIRWNKALVALGGGATPTFGTIGGSGPATAAQNAWMRILDSTGAAFWVPAWK